MNDSVLSRYVGCDFNTSCAVELRSGVTIKFQCGAVARLHLDDRSADDKSMSAHTVLHALCSQVLFRKRNLFRWALLPQDCAGKRLVP